MVSCNKYLLKTYYLYIGEYNGDKHRHQNLESSRVYKEVIGYK